jgi:hypothetical protein
LYNVSPSALSNSPLIPGETVECPSSFVATEVRKSITLRSTVLGWIRSAERVYQETADGLGLLARSVCIAESALDLVLLFRGGRVPPHDHAVADR